MCHHNSLSLLLLNFLFNCGINGNYLETIPCDSDSQLFRCLDGGCIRNDQVCDGIDQCKDKSDESRCPNLHSNILKFVKDRVLRVEQSSLGSVFLCPQKGTTNCPSAPDLCYSLLDQACDGKFTCPKGEDEVNCAPGCPNQIACSSGSGCYEPSQRCNGIRNCRDNSDETDCVLNTEMRCGPGELICRNGACVPAENLCDGTDDCGDSWDEEHCDKYVFRLFAILGIVACVFLSCVGLSCIYKFHTNRIRSSAAFLQHIDPENIDDVFVYRDPPPSYSVAVSEAQSMCVEPLEPPPRRQRRRSRRRRQQTMARVVGKAFARESFSIPVEPRAAPPSPSQSQSASRESLTSSTSLDELL